MVNFQEDKREISMKIFDQSHTTDSMMQVGGKWTMDF